jgi:hypothetical protein
MKFTWHFNHDLYRKIRKERERLGMDVQSLNIAIKDHELIGKKMYSVESKKEYTVDYVHKHWYNGWYEVLFLVDKNRSHRTVFWKSIDCRDEIILEGIGENREDLLFVDLEGNHVKEL